MFKVKESSAGFFHVGLLVDRLYCIVLSYLVDYGNPFTFVVHLKFPEAGVFRETQFGKLPSLQPYSYVSAIRLSVQ